VSQLLPAPAHQGVEPPPRRLRRFWALLALLIVVTVAGALVHRRATTAPANVGAYSATVSWPHIAGAASVQIAVDGRLVDRFPASGDDRYTISELWPATSYTVSIRLSSAHGAKLAELTRRVRTARAAGPFPRLYAGGAFINRRIGPHPALAPDSGAMAAQAIADDTGTARLLDGSQWGIPIVTADSQSDSYSVGCQYYWCNQSVTGQHIPTDAQTSTGSDGHLVVLQPNGQELDMWVGQRTGRGWQAGERSVESTSGSAANCSTVHACAGADAANFALAAGVVRPQEIAQGHIDHALAITIPDTRQNAIACPATNGDGTHTNPGAIPIGAHLQLNPNLNVSALNIPAWQKTIARALQQYGAYVTDTGGSIGIYAQSDRGLPYNAWAKAGIPADSPSLADLPWNQMRVLNITQCGQ
jgi:hypothetical protein